MIRINTESSNIFLKSWKYSIFSSQVSRDEAKIATETCIYTDTSKIRRELGWKPRSVDESLQHTVQWMQNQFN